MVDWLHSHVQGFANRSDARKYASNLLREGLIRHAVNKTKFSEQCYYVFGDTCVGTCRISNFVKVFVLPSVLASYGCQIITKITKCVSRTIVITVYVTNVKLKFSLSSNVHDLSMSDVVMFVFS